jgi:hypothetical protein
MSSVEQERKSAGEVYSQYAVQPLVSLWKDPLKELGLPTWFPKALTYILISGTSIALMYTTAGYHEFMGFGEMAGISNRALYFLDWLPIYGFVAAAVLCTLRKANETLVGMAGGLLVFGLFRSSEMQGMPAGRYWFWGVGLAIALSLFRPIYMIYHRLITSIGLAAVMPFAVAGIFLADRGRMVWDKFPHRRQHDTEMRAQPEPDPLL